FSNLDEKNITLLTFLNSNNTIFPEVRALTINEDMQASASIQLKAGDGYVAYNIGPGERWGDYTGISKKFNSTRPETWIFGCFGEAGHHWGNVIMQLTANPDLLPPPVAL